MSTFMLKFIKAIIKYVVINFYSVSLNSSSSKKALLSYIVHPYLKNNKLHPNAIEVRLIVESLIANGYSVKIVDYRRKRIHGQYDLCFGFGDAYENVLQNKLAKKNILYSTGSPFPFQNKQTLLSLKRFLDSRFCVDVSNLNSSIRLTESFWPLQLVASDAIITIGNHFIKSLFDEYNKKVYTLPAVFYESNRKFDLIKDRTIKVAKRKFLWFGGKGSIHKGLDLCIDAFKTVNAELYIAGDLSSEISIFDKEINESNNIHYLGFINVDSDRFYSLMKDCCYVILPSCSEGTATSILTVSGLCGLIPIISKECGINMDDNVIEIKSLKLEEVKNSINKAISMTDEEVAKKSENIYNAIRLNHTRQKFTEKLNFALVELECNNGYC